MNMPSHTSDHQYGILCPDTLVVHLMRTVTETEDALFDHLQGHVLFMVVFHWYLFCLLVVLVKLSVLAK